MTSSSEPQYLPVAAVARQLSVHPATVRRMIQRGELPGAIRVGRDLRVPPSALAHLIVRPAD